MTLPLLERVPLAPYTTLGLGGPARYFHECTTEAELRQALTAARERRLRVQIIGGVTFRDAPDGVELVAGAGVEWDGLVRQAVERGCAGIECLSGIPGTVGATPIQNVGAYGQEIADSLVSVRCLERASLAEVVFTHDQCEFVYRGSRFKGRDRDRFVVLAVSLRLRRDTLPQVRYAELAQAVSRHGGLEQLEPG